MRHWLMTAVLVLTANPLWGADNPAPSPTPTPAPQAENPVWAEPLGKYEKFRTGKQFMALGNIIGIGPQFTSGAGASIGYYVDSNSILFLDVAYTQKDSRTEQTDTGTLLNMWSAGVHLKQFVGNSFFVKFGIDHRDVFFNYESRNNFREVESAQRFRGTTTVAAFAIGNQWQLKHFTFGFDWGTFLIPLFYQLNDRAFLGPMGPYTRSDLAKEEDRYLKSYGFQALRVYFGGSW